MKYRTEKIQITDEAGERLAAEIRAMAGAEEGHAGPPAAYWQNLIIRVNEKIDRATSGRALSISWAARVAIPGVVAIVSFLVGLHYYAPDAAQGEPTVSDVLMSLPASSIDSLLVDPSRVDPALSVEDVGPDVFVFSRDQIAEYFMDNGNPADAVDGISDREANTVFAVLASGSK
ncbi:MAG TPA: hypothetical protein VL221_14590 [Bacteroidota bacterium]|nr:hypothetical protein [Bacteroidota bacterium]